MKKGRVRSRGRGRGRAKDLNFRLEPRKKAAPNWMRGVTRSREMTTTRTMKVNDEQPMEEFCNAITPTISAHQKFEPLHQENTLVK